MPEDAVDRMTRLGPLERSLLSAFRNAAFALQGLNIDFAQAVEADLEALVGAASRDAVLPRFRALMTTLGMHARREIHVHVPACACVGADEALFLRLNARLCAGHSRAAAALARALIEEHAVAELLHHAAALAAHWPGPERADAPALRGPTASPAEVAPPAHRLH